MLFESTKQLLIFTGYFAWKNFYYGIFIQTPADKIVLTNNRVFENTLGVWTHAYGPGSLSHVRKDKTTVIEGGKLIKLLIFKEVS